MKTICAHSEREGSVVRLCLVERRGFGLVANAKSVFAAPPMRPGAEPHLKEGNGHK